MQPCQKKSFWEDFDPMLGDAPAKLWSLLGMATAKCQYISGVPLKPGVAERLNQLSAMTSLKGTPLTVDQIQDCLQEKSNLPSPESCLNKEAENISLAYNEVNREIQSQSFDYGVSPDTVKFYNTLILDGLPLDSGVKPGKIRNFDDQNAFLGRHIPPKSDKCEELLDKLCQSYQAMESNFPEGLDPIQVAILKGVLMHLFLVWLYPFGAANGRTARLLELRSLLAGGVPMPASHLLNNHYNSNRFEYVRQLELAMKTGKTADFVLYAVQGFVERLNDQMELIRRHQLQIAWESYIHEVFHERKSASAIRQKQLTLELSKHTQPVPMRKITGISSDIALAYADKTAKTLSRDLNALRAEGLIRLEPGGYVANKKIMSAFLPPTKTDSPPSLEY